MVFYLYKNTVGGIILRKTKKQSSTLITLGILFILFLIISPDSNYYQKDLFRDLEY